MVLKKTDLNWNSAEDLMPPIFQMIDTLIPGFVIEKLSFVWPETWFFTTKIATIFKILGEGCSLSPPLMPLV